MHSNVAIFVLHSVCKKQAFVCLFVCFFNKKMAVPKAKGPLKVMASREKKKTLKREAIVHVSLKLEYM